VGGLSLVGDLRFGSAPHAVTAIVDPGDGFETYACTIDYGDGSAILPGTWVPTGWPDDLPRCVFPDHVYPAVGAYTLTAVVTDSGGASGSTRWTETIMPAIPVIQSVSAPSSVPEGSAASASAVFLPTALNETYSCTVDYGDGTGPLAGVVTGSTCQGPSHTFGRPNALLITIVVTSAGGVSSSADAVVSVTNVAPSVAPKSVPGTGVAGTAYAASVTFSDPGASLGETETCLIDYGDSGGGGWFGVISGNTCQGPQHFYASKGTYQLVATVTDSYGGVGAYSQTVTVYNPGPIVGPVVAPDSVSGGTAFRASADFTTTGRTETYSCTVDYGDRTGSQAGVVTGATCQGPSHTYKTLGTFTINVVVKGSVTGTGSASRLIGVTPPIIAVGPVSVSGSTIEGSSVTAKAGFTPTGVTETYRCTVDYGDGLGTPAGIVSGSTCTGPKHALRQGGSWIVTVSIYGSAGTYGTSSRTITVTNVAPVLTKFTVTPSAKAGATVTMSATFTDPGSTETYQVWVNWGDGSTSTYTLGSLVRATSATHSYAKVGIYTVTVNVSDGEVAADSADVAIYDPARTLTGSGTYASGVGFCQLTAKCNVASTGTLAVSAKYAAGATKPTVCLSLSAKEFTFKATTADWFVAVDGTAVIQGAGTVNGKTGYRYLTTLIDGQPDSLIINIIDSNGNTVYSTGLAPLKSGSITIK
jgi:PKD repeat protein